MGFRLRDKILGMDRICALREALEEQVGVEAAERITQGKRDSTVKQQQIALRIAIVAE